jgi:gliding motility-associated-like protein
LRVRFRAFAATVYFLDLFQHDFHQVTSVVKRSLFLCLFALLFISEDTAAQNTYQLVGTSQSVPGSDCFQVTLDQRQQFGALWARERVNLAAAFELEFLMNFGDREDGADGMVFVFQTVSSSALGGPGNGMGFNGFAPSFGVEFDIHANPTAADPPYDHIALVRNGNSQHSVTAPPVPASARSSNIEDGLDHRVRVNWNPATQRFRVWFDCELRIDETVHLIRDVFQGQTQVFWGFTGSTGEAHAPLRVCLRQQALQQKTQYLCRGEQTTLVPRPSVDGRYQWTPATGLNNPNLANPTAQPTQSQQYIASYQDFCGNLVRDTIRVVVEAPPLLDLGPDRSGCEDVSVELSPQLSGTSGPVAYRWSTGDTSRTLRPAVPGGTYHLTIQTAACRATDSVRVSFWPRPQLQTLPTQFCLVDGPVVLQAAASGTDLRYRWTPGTSTDPQLEVNQGGTYQVTIQAGSSDCRVTRTFGVDPACPPALFIPDAFSPNQDGLNDTFVAAGTESLEIEYTVLNRWGEVLFRSHAAAPAWDGTYQNTPSPAGVYAYEIRYRRSAGPWFRQRGSLLLIR